MKTELLKYINCPKCKGDLRLESFVEDQQSHIIEGIIICSCNLWFPITKGIPRMLLGELRNDYSDFIKKYKDRIPNIKLELNNSKKYKPNLTSSTSKSFGFEWSQYDRFGWEEEDLNEEIEEMDISDFSAVYQEQKFAHTIPTFRRKTLLNESNFENKLCLDVGCGNGRYTC